MKHAWTAGRERGRMVARLDALAPGLILAQAIGYVRVHPEHALLFLLPLLTAGITTFYMFRMWLLTFTGKPRDHHVHYHAHESPALLTLPLIILGTLRVCVAGGRHPHAAPATRRKRPATGPRRPGKTLRVTEPQPRSPEGRG